MRKVRPRGVVFAGLQKGSTKNEVEGLSRWSGGFESACQRHAFDPWSGEIPYAMGQLSPCATTIELMLYNC